ncbi:MAG: hypothetical protein CM15mP40_01700 [Alphaproteobacteria bacterium]|nr:MAG: hypothetical protein CM15mP40_01700 [Alphaproteobacteria bacterium]
MTLFKVRVYCSNRGFMSRMSVFNSPFLLGFDQFERTVDRISKLSSDSTHPIILNKHHLIVLG